MSIDSHGARITRRDVVELNTASEQLAVAADTIRRMRPAWGEAVVNLLIAVNVTNARLQNKGAAAFARYLEKRGPETLQDVLADALAEEQTNPGRKTPPDEPET